jgi:hypothetical protein
MKNFQANLLMSIIYEFYCLVEELLTKHYFSFVGSSLANFEKIATSISLKLMKFV